MRFLRTIAFATCFSVSALSANASVYWCFRLPFTGGWAAGYAPAPTYSGSGLYSGYGYQSYGGYAPFSGGLYSARYGGYASYGSLCCPSSCLPRHNNCSTGCGVSISGSSCNAACGGSVTSDKVPGPIEDPDFREGNDVSPNRSENDGDPDSDKNWEPGRNGDNSGRDEISNDGDGEFSERPRRKPWETESNSDAAPKNDNGLDRFNERLSPNPQSTPDDFSAPDEFRAPDEPGDLFNQRFDSGGDGLDGLEPTDNGRLNFKPELSEPVDESGESVGSGSDIVVPPTAHEPIREGRVFRGLLSQDQARTNHSEVPSRFRLATHRLPLQQRTARLFKKTKKHRRALRWIGAPATDSRVRL